MSIMEIRTVRGIEVAQANARGTTELRLVPTTVNGRSEMLPDSPHAVAKILSERRAKLSPAQRTKARLKASQKSRGI